MAIKDGIELSHRGFLFRYKWKIGTLNAGIKRGTGCKYHLVS